VGAGKGVNVSWGESVLNISARDEGEDAATGPSDCAEVGVEGAAGGAGVEAAEEGVEDTSDGSTFGNARRRSSSWPKNHTIRQQTTDIYGRLTVG